MAAQEGLRHRARRRRRQATDAADGGPREARRSVRRAVPADRLRAVEPDQLRTAPDRRAHPVQVAQPRPARLADLAPVAGCSTPTSRRCPPSSGSASAGSAGSADAILQSLNLIRDEKPDIVVVVGADHVYRMDFSQMIEAHIESGARRHGRRDPSADLARRPVRRDRGRREGPDAHRGVPREAEEPDGPARTPPTRCSRRWATTSSTPTRSSTRCCATASSTDSSHDMGGDIVPDFVGARRGGRLRPQAQRGARLDRSRPLLLARRRERSTRSSRPTRTSSRCCRSSTSTTATGRSSASSSTRRRRSSCATRAAALGTVIDSIVSLGCVISGAHVERSVLGPWAIVESGAQVVDSIVFDRVRIERGRRRAARYPRQGGRRRGRCDIGVDHDADSAPGLHRHRHRHHRRRQGRPRPGSTACIR